MFFPRSVLVRLIVFPPPRGVAAEAHGRLVPLGRFRWPGPGDPEVAETGSGRGEEDGGPVPDPGGEAGGRFGGVF